METVLEQGEGGMGGRTSLSARDDDDGDDDEAQPNCASLQPSF